jgi:hypothetical protein
MIPNVFMIPPPLLQKAFLHLCVHWLREGMWEGDAIKTPSIVGCGRDNLDFMCENVHHTPLNT